MRGALIFTAGVMAGMLMANPAVQRRAKEGMLDLVNYTRETINGRIIPNEKTNPKESEDEIIVNEPLSDN